MAGPLAGKVAIVTGASRGIGRAIAQRLGRDGANVVLCARTATELDQAVKEIGTAAAIALDLRLPESGRKLVDFTLATYGRIDIVVNNAGATRRGSFVNLTDDDFADGFALKYFGAVRVTRAAWPPLQSSQGSVVFISGAGGRTPGAQFAVGGSVNAALLSLTKALAEQGIADGVQVNCINPGTVRTARFTARLKEISEAQYVKDARVTRVGEPEEIAALVAFIAGPEGRFLQGSLIDADGGATKTI